MLRSLLGLHRAGPRGATSSATRRAPLGAARALCFAAALLLLGCHRPGPGGATAEIARLQHAAERALAHGEPRLAMLLVRKAGHAGELPPSTALIGARGAAMAGELGEAYDLLVDGLSHGLSAPAALQSPELAPLRSDPSFPRLVAWAERNARHAPTGPAAAFPPTTPAAAGLDARSLAHLLDEAKRFHTSELVLLKDGKLTGDWTFGGKHRRIEAMSATKSVVELAVLFLVQEGRIRSLDEPASDFLTEWRDTDKAAVTIRQMLDHTTGILTRRTTGDIYSQRDIVRYGLGRPRVDPPGSHFAYNNSVTNLVAALVARVAGEPIDVYLQARLFDPLGIEDVTWSRDAVGNRFGMAGLQIQPLDFARIGQLLLQKGEWNGRRLLAPELIAESTRSSQSLNPRCGLLWWLVPKGTALDASPVFFAALAKNGVGKGTLAALRARISGPTSATRFGAVLTELKPYQVADLRRNGPAVLRDFVRGTGYQGYAAEGYLGQFLVVLPDDGVVAVRMTDDYDDEERAVEWPFPDALVELLHPSQQHPDEWTSKNPE